MDSILHLTQYLILMTEIYKIFNQKLVGIPREKSTLKDSDVEYS